MADQQNSYVLLKRGGVLIQTPAGYFQFGIPPETIKDTMGLEGSVPRVFIVPEYMFDLQYGVALAEMEFPIYYNFFIKNQKTIIICNENQQKRIVTIIYEAMFGPRIINNINEFSDGENTPGYTDLKTEMDHFKKSISSKNHVDIEDLIEFYIFDNDGKTNFNGVDVQFDSFYNITVSAKGKVIAFIARNMPIMPIKTSFSESRFDFRPPLFGVTTLGAGHGFDPEADTSGLIIWVNKRGIMVDPPVNATEKLLTLGVSPKWIDNIILTHCHADHDAGTLQKILQEGKVNLYSTNTIYNSFVRKAEALTGIEESRLNRLVRFFPLSIGKPIIIGGATFNFGYNLHSIPTISIQACYRAKSMVYSSDTVNDPQYIEKLYEDGVITENRRNYLLNFPWDRDVVFHEAGIPPIHTPLSYLCSLPEQVRKRIFLVHVNSDAIPKDSGLRIAPTGLSNTIELNVDPLPYEDAIEMLDVFSRVELFENLTLEKARAFLLVAEIERYKSSEVIFHKDSIADRFYVVMSGEVDIILDGDIITTYTVGGYFGEKGLLHDEKRTATAKARTGAKLLAIRKEELLSLIRGTESDRLLRQIADFQNVDLRDTLKDDPILGSLTATQQTSLQGLIRPFRHPFRRGEVIADSHSEMGITYIIREGAVDVYDRNNLIDTLTRGRLFGVKALLSEKDKRNLSFIAREETHLYYIAHTDLEMYLDTNPGIYIKMYHSHY